RAIGEVHFPSRGSRQGPRVAQSTPSKPRLLSVKPSIDRKTAVGEFPGRTPHRSDFVRQPTGKHHQLILSRDDIAIVRLARPARFVNPKLASTELFWFAMKKINKGDFSRCDLRHCVVAVAAEEVAVVAGRGLRFDQRDGEGVASPLSQNEGQAIQE